MKSTLLVFFAFYFTAGSAQQFASAFEQLAYVNAQWRYQHDVDPALKASPPKPLSEQQLIQFHLQETEKMLHKRDKRNLSATQLAQRAALLNTLHGYEERGLFPVNDGHANRQPYFIDKYNTYCAVGYLMQQSGAEKMARDIHDTQNFSYLEDIHHPQLMEWVSASGLSLDELALIQPGYPGGWPCAVMEFHYNNAGTDVGEYLEVHESSAQLSGNAPFHSVVLIDNAGNTYKTLLKGDMQFLPGMAGYYYNFGNGISFADKGKIVVLVSYGATSQIDTAQIISYSDTAVDERRYGYNSTFVEIRHFSVSENENTQIGSSLTYCGFFYDPTWSLQHLNATPGTVNSCLVMPLSMGNITCTAIGRKVQINWQTLSENNVKSFTIERSADGSNFTPIGTISASGGSQLRNYSFTDEQPSYINHYRIKQTDVDGKYSYSKKLYIKVAEGNPLEVAGNITGEALTINVRLPQASIQSLSLYDFSGRLLQKFTAREGLQTLHVCALSSGNYLLQLTTADGQAFNRRLMK